MLLMCRTKRERKREREEERERGEHTHEQRQSDKSELGRRYARDKAWRNMLVYSRGDRKSRVPRHFSSWSAHPGENQPLSTAGPGICLGNWVPPAFFFCCCCDKYWILQDFMYICFPTTHFLTWDCGFYCSSVKDGKSNDNNEKSNQH